MRAEFGIHHRWILGRWDPGTVRCPIPPTQKTRCGNVQVHTSGRVGIYCRIWREERSLVVDSCCYKEEPNRIKVEKGREKTQEQIQKRRQKGGCWDSGYGCLPSKGTGEEWESWRSVVGQVFIFGVTHDRKHIRCKRSRSCRLSGHGRRHRCLWSCKPPCGSQRRPVCQRLAPRR